MVASYLEVAFIFCWVIVADTAGYQNLFVKFLSQRFFIRYSKTTYATYLISPIVATLIGGLTNEGLSYDFPIIVSLIELREFYYWRKFNLGHHDLCDNESFRSGVILPYCSFWSAILQFVEVLGTERSRVTSCIWIRDISTPSSTPDMINSLTIK